MESLNLNITRKQQNLSTKQKQPSWFIETTKQTQNHKNIVVWETDQTADAGSAIITRTTRTVPKSAGNGRTENEHSK